LKKIELNKDQKIYFASDFHLGAPNHEESRKRELCIIDWLNYVQKDAQVIFFVGDIFDFWYEYKKVIPKGFVRIQGKIAELVDNGIQVYFFLGNHDMWMKKYFTEEIGVLMIKDELQIQIDDKKFYISHGDGLGPGDFGYKFIKKVFRNRICQFLFSCIHPSIGIPVANFFSNRSRSHNKKEDAYSKKENEWLYQFCTEKLKKEHFDYFIFGHRHLPMHLKIQSSSYINLGEWMHYQTYAIFEHDTTRLLEWKDGNCEPFKGIQE